MAFKVVIPKIRKAWASLNLRNSLSSTFVAKLGGDGKFAKFMPGVAGAIVLQEFYTRQYTGRCTAAYGDAATC